MSIYRILIRRDCLYDGLNVILCSGPGIFGQRENEFYVTEAGLKALDQGRIPYSARDSRGHIMFRNRNAPRRRLSL